MAAADWGAAWPFVFSKTPVSPSDEFLQRMSIITLITDFGPGSHYVAAMKGVILSL